MTQLKLDLSHKQPAPTEDDIKIQRILMAEMLDNGPDAAAKKQLELDRDRMLRAKLLKQQRKREND